MAGQTVSAHLDEALVARLREASRTENRPASQLLGVALKSFLDLAPGSRQALFSIDGSCTETEKAFVAKFLSRQALRAYQAVLEARHMDANRVSWAVAGSNAEPATEEDIEAEAARACRM